MPFDLRKNDWGGSVTIAGHAVSIRQIAGAAGIGLWLSLMLMRNGSAGIASLATTVQFAITLLLLTSATRSIRLRSLLSMFLAGGFMMGIIVILGKILGLSTGSVPAHTAVAMIEEAALLAPPIFLLWRWRKTRMLSLGASDIFLLFAACGAGFAMVETANILRERSLDQFTWLPVLAMDGDRIHGYYIFGSHEIWAGVAGIGIGLAWLLRSKGTWVWLIAIAGIALGTIDHFVLDAKGGGLIVDVLGTLTGRGVVTIAAFVFGAIAAVAIDAHIIYRKMPVYLWSLLKKPLWSKAGVGSLLDLRALAFADYQTENAAEWDRPSVASSCVQLTDRLLANR
jgi:hypothetical protein